MAVACYQRQCQMESNDKLVTVLELAADLECTHRTVDRLVAAGLLRAVRAARGRGGAALYRLEDGRAAMAAHRATTQRSEAEAVRIEDYRTSADDLNSKRRVLEREFVAPASWLPAWRAHCATVRDLTRS